MAANDPTRTDRIDALRLRASVEDDDDLRFLIEVIDDLKRTRVQIVRKLNLPTECKVWRDEALEFDGVDRSVLLRMNRA